MPDFVDRFAAWWSDPDPSRLGELLADDVVLIQPLSPDTHNLADGQEGFRRLLRFLPDLRASVHGSAADGNVLFIHFTLSATYGGRPISWEAVDRFVLREDGRASERVSWFDSAPLIAQIAMRPQGWPQLVRSGFRPQLGRSRPRPRRSAAAGARPSS